MKQLIYSEYGPTKPDLIIFDSEYTNFWIVEVETSAHAWKGDVYEQMKKITTGEYSSVAFEILQSIKSKGAKDIDDDSFIDLIESVTPRFLLVIDGRPNWYESFQESELEFEYIEMEVFKDADLNFIYFISGSSLDISDEDIIIKPTQSGNYFELESSSASRRFRESKKITARYKTKELTLSIVDNVNECMVWVFDSDDANLSFKHAYKLRKSSEEDLYSMTRF